MSESGSNQRDCFVFCHCAVFLDFFMTYSFSLVFFFFGCCNLNIIFRIAEAEILWLELGMTFLVLGCYCEIQSLFFQS